MAVEADKWVAEQQAEEVRWRWRQDRRNRRLNTELLAAVGAGDVSKVDRCLQHGASPNATCGPLGVTACHLSALTGNCDVTSLLLRRGASARALDPEGCSPLHWAAWCGSAGTMKLILADAGDTLNSKTGRVLQRPAALQEAVDSWRHDHEGLRKQMPELEAGSTALHIACQRLHLDCIALLLEAGADLAVQDNCGMAPIDVVGEKMVQEKHRGSAAERLPRALRMLLSAGTRPSPATDSFRSTPMHHAVAIRSLDAITMVARFPLHVDRQGRTPLHLAVTLRVEDSLKVLLKTYVGAGGATEADSPSYNRSESSSAVDMRGADGNTSLHDAIVDQWLPGVEMFLEAGADVCERNRSGSTALHLAAGTGNFQILRDVLEIPDSAKVLNAEDLQGETPLFRAISGGDVRSVAMLLDAGAALHHALEGSVTVLHRAAELDRPQVLGELLSRDQSRAMLDGRTEPGGMTPLHVAAALGHTHCATALLSAGCDVTATTFHDHSTALHLAAPQGHADVLRALLYHRRGATVLEARDGRGCTALHLACQQGRRDCVRALVRAGADLSARTSGTSTAMDLLLSGVTQPVDFLEQQLRLAVTMNDVPVHDEGCVVRLDYGLLVAGGGREMGVLDALCSAGVQCGQERLLLHPLVQSFLALKWSRLCHLFYLVIAVYSAFLACFTATTITLYYCGGGGPLTAWRSSTLVFLALFTVQEVIHLVEMPKVYLRDWESWLKWICFVLSTMVVVVEHQTDDTWPRQVTTVAILLVWLEYMFLLCRDPSWGYYVLMFTRVAFNVFKVLATFVFLIVGFSLAFMVQFECQPPFPSPLEAFLKTTVMMADDLNYSDLMDSSGHLSSPAVVRLLFLALVVLGSIVLMNLLVGVSVSDISALEAHGKMNRLRKQVDFACVMERIARYTRRAPSAFRGGGKPTLLIHPGRPGVQGYRGLSRELVDGVVAYALEQKKADTQCGLDDVCRRIDDLCDRAQDAEEVLSKLREIVGQRTEDTTAFREHVSARIGRVERDLSATLQATNDILQHITSKTVDNDGARSAE